MPVLAAGLAVAVAVSGCGEAEPAAGRQGDWREVAGSPLSPRVAAVGVWTGREVLLIGGRNGSLCPPNVHCVTDGTPLADGAALDPRTGRWRRIADAPVPVPFGQAVVLGQTAYLLPTPGPVDQDGLLAYRIDEDRWHWLPVPFDTGAWYQLTTAGDRLIASLQSDEAGPGEDFSYHPETGDWTALPPDPLGDLHGRTMVWTGDELVLFGNRLAHDPAAPPPVVSAAAHDPASGTWRELPDSEILASAPWVVADGSLVNPTMHDGGGTHPYGGKLDPATGQWSPLPERPAGAEFSAGAYTGSTAIYHGVRDVVLDVAADRWVRLPAVPDRVDSGRTVLAAGTDLVAFGGVHWTSDAEPELTHRTWLWSPPR